MALQALLINLAAGASPWKHAVRVVATSNITLSGLQTIDGVALAEGDRVLVAGQTDAKQNGIYDAKSSAWVRSSDLDENSELKLGTITVALGGTTHQLSLWVLSSPTTGTLRLGSDNLTFTKLLDVDAVTALGITSTGDLTLTCAAGSRVKCTENGVETFDFYDEAGVSTALGKSATGTRIASNAGTMTISGATSVVFQEGSTPILTMTDAAGIGQIDFSSGNIVAASVLKLSGASYVNPTGANLYSDFGAHNFRSQDGSQIHAVIDTATGVVTIGRSGTSPIHAVNSSWATTVGAAGGGSALPATPVGYWRVSINGTTRKIPFYVD